MESKKMFDIKQISIKEFIIFFALPVLSYVGFATDFTFDFFQPDRHWRAYNEYFLSLIDGRLDVPAYAIGKEGQYIDKKIYMYYGLLPALTRFFFHPFLNLHNVPVASFSVWFFSIIGATTLQLSILNKYKKSIRTGVAERQKLIALLMISTIVWFCSASFMINQSGRIFHEPYAASLCIVNIYVALLLRDDFFLKGSKNTIPYALLAGLCIHARMPTALALYCSTIFLMVINTNYCLITLDNNTSTIKKTIKWLTSFVIQQWISLLLMLIFGLSILIMNYVRFGNILSFMGVPYHYGFILTFDGDFANTHRLCPNVIPKAEFSGLRRIIPNFIVYLIGGWNLHDKLMHIFQTGFGRKELPIIPIGLLWLSSISMLIWSFFYYIKIKTAKSFKILLLGVLFSIGGIYQLTYETITHRYIAELWPVVLLFSIIFFDQLISGQLKLNKFVLRFFCILTFLALIYNIYVSFSSEYHLRPYVGEKSEYDDPKEDIIKLESFNKESLDIYIEKFIAIKKEGCNNLIKKLNPP